MTAKTKRALVPKLRFPEFRDAGEWEEKVLAQVCEINPPTKDLPDYFIYIDLESVEAGKLAQEKVISLKEAPSRAQRLLKRGDVLFQTVRPYQKNNYFFQPNNDLGYVASTGYAQLRARESNMYLFQYLHNDRFVARVLAKCTGSNYPAINSSDLSEITIEIPNFKEQQKIADCLSSIDELITLEARKIDALKAHKKGLMQQLFPAEGETLPKLRFPEFRDAGEWNSYDLGDVVHFSSGGTPSKAIADYWGGTIPWISASSMYEIYIDKSELNVTPMAIGNGTRIAKKGSLLVLVRGSMLFNRIPMGIATIDVAFNQDVKALEISDNLSNLFLLFQLISFESRIPINETGIGAGKIETDDLKNLAVFVPAIEEQQKIADCLNSVDELIILQSRKLDALKAHKKGLLQQLFPSLDERPFHHSQFQEETEAAGA